MSSVWLGVDIAKASLAAAVIVEGEVSLGEFKNDLAGFTALAEQVAGYMPAESGVHLVIEPTGSYELALVAFAYERGWAVSLPNPKQLRDWAKGAQRAPRQRAKTDGQDARLLARYGAACQPAGQAPLAHEVSELDSLLKRRQDLEQMLQQEKNRAPRAPEEMAGRPGIARAVDDSLAEVIAALQEALRRVEEAIAHHLQQHTQLAHDAKRLLALPREPSGRGPKVVLPLLVMLQRWQTLTAGQGHPEGSRRLYRSRPPTLREWREPSGRCTPALDHLQDGQRRDAPSALYGSVECRAWPQSLASLLRTTGRTRQGQKAGRHGRGTQAADLGLDTL